MITVIHNGEHIYSNAGGASDVAAKVGGGAATGGVVGAISGAVDSGFKFGTQLAQNKNDRDTLGVKALMQKKQGELELQKAAIQSKSAASSPKNPKKDNTKKIIIISAIVAVLFITGIIVYVKMKD